MQTDQSAVLQRKDSTLATHKVLRNTYFLLGMTLLFSSATAAFAVISGAPQPGLILTLVAYFGLLFLTRALRNSAWGLVSTFAFTGFLGYTLGPMLTMVLTQFTNVRPPAPRLVPGMVACICSLSTGTRGFLGLAGQPA